MSTQRSVGIVSMTVWRQCGHVSVTDRFAIAESRGRGSLHVGRALQLRVNLRLWHQVHLWLPARLPFPSRPAVRDCLVSSEVPLPLLGFQPIPDALDAVEIRLQLSDAPQLRIELPVYVVEPVFNALHDCQPSTVFRRDPSTRHPRPFVRHAATSIAHTCRSLSSRSPRVCQLPLSSHP
jgi:hypothetical protein